MRIKLALSLLILFLCVQNISAQPGPEIPWIDHIRLAEAFRIGATLGNRVWKDWDKAPFAVLLITQQNEFLIRHPKPSKDFKLVGYDALLRSNIYFRQRALNPSLLATFPIEGVPTIVIGQAENTSQKTSTPWVLTIMHEHFHQLQNSQPNYYTDVNALGLARGDQTGMWMLNYPFPYTDPKLNQQFTLLSRLLLEALQTKKKNDLKAKVADYLLARQQFEALLSPDDDRYFSFQVWQEGMARYTEHRIADLAAKKYRPGKAFRSLKDYRSFDKVASETMRGTLKELSTLRLLDDQRVDFYPIGAGEGLLLDSINARWQALYFVNRFQVDKYFKTAR